MEIVTLSQSETLSKKIAARFGETTKMFGVSGD